MVPKKSDLSGSELPRIYFDLGSALQDKGKFEEAVSCYRKTLELKPDTAGAYINLGIVFQEIGRLNDAIAYYRKALKLKPDSVIAYFNLGSALQDQGKPDKAVSCYRKALRIKPEAGIENNAAPVHTGVNTCLVSLPQERCNVPYHIIILRVLLHRSGLALHMHQADLHPEFRTDLDCTARLQGIDIVDHISPFSHCCTHDLGLAGVYGYRYRGLFPDCPNNGDHPFKFFIHCYRLRTRARGFTAYINDICAFLLHAKGVLDGLIDTTEPAAIGKRIGGDVQDPHHD